jgi:hypothetical protein
MPPGIRCPGHPHSQRESADHPHVHGEGCGHETVQPGDHVDYVHDGHRHAGHEGHDDVHDEARR